MRLVTYDDGRADRLGADLGQGRLLDLAAAADAQGVTAGPFASMLALIEAGPVAWERARDLVARPPAGALRDLDGVRLRAPLPLPPQIRDFMCFEKHVIQAFAAAFRLRASRAGSAPEREQLLAQAAAYRPPEAWYQQPVYYKANRFAVSGPDETVEWPAYSQLMDYECELACVIGKGGRDIPAGRAREHIFGFTIMNDFSARDAQAVEMAGGLGPAKGKDFDKANAFGPCIVTADELGDPYDLAMIVRVNGEERSRGHSGSMHWKFEDLIAHVSRGETLHPGEILGSGTVGDGCGLEQLRFLEDGDIVELEIPRIGTLRNRVVRAAGDQG
jgi:2-keto-4-pentenoate hydratase/2-oxohepta-3-ene-1,7-dioic acid hydratase in catechol pathway